MPAGKSRNEIVYDCTTYAQMSYGKGKMHTGMSRMQKNANLQPYPFDMQGFLNNRSISVSQRAYFSKVSGCL